MAYTAAYAWPSLPSGPTATATASALSSSHSHSTTPASLSHIAAAAAPSWLSSLTPLFSSEAPEPPMTYFQTPPDPHVPRPDLTAAIEPIALFPPATFPHSALPSQPDYSSAESSTAFHYGALPPTYANPSSSATSSASASNVMSAPYFSQSSASKAYISIVDADLSAMSHGDLLQIATSLQAEVRHWRAVENQRFRDDRDPATVKTFLRLANEEVERLRGREAELEGQLAQSQAQRALTLSHELEPLRAQVAELKRREAELLAELQASRAQHAVALAREVEPLAMQVAGSRKREARLKDEVQRATAALALLPALQREVEDLRDREAVLLAELHAAKRAPQDPSKSHSEVGRSGHAVKDRSPNHRPAAPAAKPEGVGKRERPFFGLELADGIKYSKDQYDTSDAFGAVKVVTAVGPGELAGLQPGDLITSMNGFPVETLQDFNRAVLQVWAGDVVSVNFDRDDRSYHTVLRTELTTGKPHLQPAPPPKGR
eukprot:EG_transcript_7478